MKNRFLTALMLCISAMAGQTLFAHLCNDVFDQSQDDLAVKVDIRDGQLRIAKEAKFRVYLLNTMDRPIAKINLAVKSEKDVFDAEVKPSATWKNYPQLQTSRKGGKKEYFEVTLSRKSGIPDGAYKIELVLFNPANNRNFKTLELEKAADISTLPKTKSVAVDGNCPEAEWKDSLLCSSFYAYELDMKKKYMETSLLKSQPRIRVMSDSENLYFMMAMDAGASADVFIAQDNESAPVKLSFNPELESVASSQGEASGIVVKKSGKGGIEAKVPFSAAGVQNPKRFYLNFSVKQGDAQAFWRGNSYSYENPLVFAEIVSQ